VVTPEKIEEWIREVEERPASAPTILRYIARRLSDLASRNEELLSDNIQLRLGHKVDEYESRISNLEYQLQILKRQLGGEAALPERETTSVILFNNQGRILRFELDPALLASGNEVASFKHGSISSSTSTGLLVTDTQEELLFVFDSGRALTLAAAKIPAMEKNELAWEDGYWQEPQALEELVAVLPVAKMSLYDFCVQFTRRGYIKKAPEVSFEAHLANNFIGTGVKTQVDQTCGLLLCNKDDLVVLASREGRLVGLEVGRLPFTIEEGFRIDPSDHVVAGFLAGDKPYLVMATENGKAVHRETGWLEPAAGLKLRGQPVISKARRDAGMRLVGAASINENDWGLLLREDGKLIAYRMEDVFKTGSFFGGDESKALNFTTFSISDSGKENGKV
jgi:DNA gyrase/topoisomerase IV subunit A